MPIQPNPMGSECEGYESCPPFADACNGYVGGAFDRSSMMSTHVAIRRFDRRIGGLETGEGDPSFSKLCLARKDRTRSRLCAAPVKPSSTVILTWPNTRKNPRPRSTKDPLRAALT